MFYQHQSLNTDQGTGWEISVEEGDTAFIGTAYNDQVSTIYVQPYCEVQLFSDSNFSPNSPKILHGYKDINAPEKRFNLLDVDPQWNNQVSSYKCYCERGKSMSIFLNI